MPVKNSLSELGLAFGMPATARAASVSIRVFSADVSVQDRDFEWKKVIRAIHGMLALRDDWDGLGAKSPSSDIISAAMRLADAKRRTNESPAPTRVAPTPAGTIAMEWQQGSVYTEAEVVAPDRSEWMQIANGLPTEHWVEVVPHDVRGVSDADNGVTQATIDQLNEIVPAPTHLPTVYWGRCG
jgi:hypothetical protein